MKSIILSISLALVACVSANAQYHLRLKFEYFDKDGNVRPAMEGRETLFQDYYIVEGRTKSVFDQGFVVITDCSEPKYKKVMYKNGEKQPDTDKKALESRKLISSKKLKDTEVVMGYTCQSVKHKFADGSVLTSFYSDQVAVDPELYNHKDHEEYELLKDKKGGLDLKFIVEQEGRSKVVATTVLIEKIEYKPEDFDMKKFLKSHLDENQQLFTQLLSDFKSKYKFEALPDDFIAKGVISQGEISFPVDLKVKNPNMMLMKMDFGAASFLTGSNGNMTWQYNPVDQKVNVTDKGIEGYDFLGQFLPNLTKDWNELSINSFIDIDSAYRVVFRKVKNSSSSVCYFNKESLLISKKFDEGSYYMYADYKEFNNYPAPTKYQQYFYGEERAILNATFDQFEFNRQIDNEVFEIPENLKDKVVGDKATKLVKSGKNAIDYFNEAEALADKDNYKEAIPLYKQAIQLNNNIATYHNQLGLALLETEDYYGAVAEFSRALEIDPVLAVAKNNLGYAKMHFGDFKAAIVDINEAIRLDGENASFYSNRANCYLNFDEYDSALLDYKMVIQLDSTTFFGYYNLAMSYYHLENYDSAIMNFDKSERAKLYAPGDLFNYRGICNYNLENYEGAVADFQKATKSDEPELMYFSNLGQTYSEIGDSKKAIVAYNEAIKMDSTYAEGHNLIGLEYYNQELYNEAINSFNEAIAINGKEAVYYDNRARAKSEKMDYVGAIEDLSHSINLYPDDASIYYLRGLTKQHINEKFDACLDFKKASEMGLDEASDTMNDYCLSGG
ncbi:tetratricopeptide repeat protein [Fulvivirga ligni]|uniref:tetratricopeptide repeat protein n=1 Tax=Fulvivirga ligni TaxID=2904246 RepID=UPI001F16D15A|nr:tetratricopeptide repeat protein [Fulvivirga ligni]UII24013.1 tetratricopeptide repeat protein [Fulvivirga ligni]